MWASFWDWLKDENNRGALGVIGGAVAFLWTVFWAIYKSAAPTETESERQSATPASQISYNQRQRPVRMNTYRSMGLRIPIWAIGILALAGIWYGWESHIAKSPELPKPPEIPVLRVCRGEFEARCSAHDRFIGCGDINTWAAQACKRSFSLIATDSDVPGNKCGYALMRVRCAE
jgi:hypothetical protein